MSIFIVVPAYNEEKRIVDVIKDLKDNKYNNIIVVDDGSKDDTSIIAEREGITVLKHVINRGQGAALQTGISYALDNGAEYIVTFDADGQHRASEIKNLLDPVKEGVVDVTLGSRFLEINEEMPRGRSILLKGSTIIDWIFSGGQRLTDAHNGFRVLSRNAAKGIQITEDGMTHASEIIQKIKTNNLKFKEIPVNIRYSKETMGKGQSALHSVNILFRLIFRRLL
ncbi:MAG: glycosyltransferase family 2 protein [Candidatus Woesearchaeota archaeon]|nr:MAG: glycosyltransferase family 2 protein [Candidatus Woesearchaeota archaeon]